MQSATASLEQERLVAIDRWLNPPQYKRRISLKLVIIDLLGLISTCYASISKVYHRLVPTGRIFSVGWLGFIGQLAGNRQRTQRSAIEIFLWDLCFL